MQFRRRLKMTETTSFRTADQANANHTELTKFACLFWPFVAGIAFLLGGRSAFAETEDDPTLGDFIRHAHRAAIEAIQTISCRVTEEAKKPDEKDFQILATAEYWQT